MSIVSHPSDNYEIDSLHKDPFLRVFFDEDFNPDAYVRSILRRDEAINNSDDSVAEAALRTVREKTAKVQGTVRQIVSRHVDVLIDQAIRSREFSTKVEAVADSTSRLVNISSRLRSTILTPFHELEMDSQELQTFSDTMSILRATNSAISTIAKLYILLNINYSALTSDSSVDSETVSINNIKSPPENLLSISLKEYVRLLVSPLDSDKVDPRILEKTASFLKDLEGLNKSPLKEINYFKPHAVLLSRIRHAARDASRTYLIRSLRSQSVSDIASVISTLKILGCVVEVVTDCLDRFSASVASLIGLSLSPDAVRAHSERLMRGEALADSASALNPFKILESGFSGELTLPAPAKSSGAQSQPERSLGNVENSAAWTGTLWGIMQGLIDEIVRSFISVWVLVVTLGIADEKGIATSGSGFPVSSRPVSSQRTILTDFALAFDEYTRRTLSSPPGSSHDHSSSLRTAEKHEPCFPHPLERSILSSVATNDNTLTASMFPPNFVGSYLPFLLHYLSVNPGFPTTLVFPSHPTSVDLSNTRSSAVSQTPRLSSTEKLARSQAFKAALDQLCQSMPFDVAQALQRHLRHFSESDSPTQLHPSLRLLRRFTLTLTSGINAEFRKIADEGWHGSAGRVVSSALVEGFPRLHRLLSGMSPLIYEEAQRRISDGIFGAGVPSLNSAFSVHSVPARASGPPGLASLLYFYPSADEFGNGYQGISVSPLAPLQQLLQSLPYHHFVRAAAPLSGLYLSRLSLRHKEQRETVLDAPGGLPRVSLQFSFGRNAVSNDEMASFILHRASGNYGLVDAQVAHGLLETAARSAQSLVSNLNSRNVERFLSLLVSDLLAITKPPHPTSDSQSTAIVAPPTISSSNKLFTDDLFPTQSSVDYDLCRSICKLVLTGIRVLSEKVKEEIKSGFEVTVLGPSPDFTPSPLMVHNLGLLKYMEQASNTLMSVLGTMPLPAEAELFLQRSLGLQWPSSSSNLGGEHPAAVLEAVFAQPMLFALREAFLKAHPFSQAPAPALLFVWAARVTLSPQSRKYARLLPVAVLKIFSNPFMEGTLSEFLFALPQTLIFDSLAALEDACTAVLYPWLLSVYRPLCAPVLALFRAMDISANSANSLNSARNRGTKNQHSMQAALLRHLEQFATAITSKHLPLLPAGTVVNGCRNALVSRLLRVTYRCLATVRLHAYPVTSSTAGEKSTTLSENNPPTTVDSSFLVELASIEEVASLILGSSQPLAADAVVNTSTLLDPSYIIAGMASRIGLSPWSVGPQQGHIYVDVLGIVLKNESLACPSSSLRNAAFSNEPKLLYLSLRAQTQLCFASAAQLFQSMKLQQKLKILSRESPLLENNLTNTDGSTPVSSGNNVFKNVSPLSSVLEIASRVRDLVLPHSQLRLSLHQFMDMWDFVCSIVAGATEGLDVISLVKACSHDQEYGSNAQFTNFIDSIDDGLKRTLDSFIDPTSVIEVMKLFQHDKELFNLKSINEVCKLMFFPKDIDLYYTEKIISNCFSKDINNLFDRTEQSRSNSDSAIYMKILKNREVLF